MAPKSLIHSNCGCPRGSSLSYPCHEYVIMTVVMILSTSFLVMGSTTSAVSAPALLVFGDSVVDPGNNNNRTLSIAKCNYPPYGRDFQGGKPTGRFSNGKIPSDFMAQGLGIKDLLPAYLDPGLGIEDLLTGVSFATGGTGFDPLTSTIETAVSLTDQLKLFEEYTGKLRSAVGKKRTSAIVSNSIYLVCAGSNDIANAYFLTGLRRIQYNSFDSYSDFLIDQADHFLRDLYKLGARRIVIIGAPPLGCLPSQRTLAGGLVRTCVQEYNQASQQYNTKLQTSIQSLSTQLPGAKLAYSDMYTPLLNLIENPFRSGFTVANKGCCATGNIEVLFLCTLGNSNSCVDADKYVFWDSFHPTEAAYRLLVDQLLNSTSFKSL